MINHKSAKSNIMQSVKSNNGEENYQIGDFIAKQLDKNIEEILNNHLKGLDLQNILHKFFEKNQAQIINQLLKTLGGNIMSNGTDTFGNSIGQVIGQLAGAIHKGIARHL